MNTSHPTLGVATIDASQRWNITDIVLQAGYAYDFSATGKWRDSSIKCDADGYPPPELSPWQKLILYCFSPLRRVPSEKWFTLIGVIDQDLSTAFRIGQNARGVKISRTGKLTCFANDVPFMYWNNCGELTLTVTEAVNERISHA